MVTTGVRRDPASKLLRLHQAAHKPSESLNAPFPASDSPVLSTGLSSHVMSLTLVRSVIRLRTRFLECTSFTMQLLRNLTPHRSNCSCRSHITDGEIEMPAQANRALSAAALVAVAALNLCVAANAMEQATNSAPSLRLNDFGKYESKPLVLGSEVSPSDVARTTISQVIENVINSKVKQWNADGILRGKRKLIIQPEIVELRLGNKAVIRNSQFKLRLNLTDAVSGEIIGRPEFTQQASAVSSLFTQGRSDEGMYNTVVKSASAYLDSNYQTAVDEISQEHQRIFSQLTEAAERGDVVAQLALGTLYSEGKDAVHDDRQAAVWWQKAAEQGSAEAQLRLGWAYANGRGVTQDDKAAVACWRKAAGQGNAQAQAKLGWMYDSGRGVIQSEKEAVAWYRKAADQGDAAAKTYVARKERGTTRFSSFDDARAALNPEGGFVGDMAIDPMALKGRILALRLEVVQVFGNGQMLVTNPYTGVPQLDGKIYYANISGSYAGSREFVDGQQIVVVGEITGTFRYTTARSASKTVPEITVYGIRAGY